jgi:hypothetical protein
MPNAAIAQNAVRAELNSCNRSEFLAALSIGYTADIAVMALGTFGIGKSEIIQGFARQKGAGIVDVRLSQIAPEDAGGIPYPNLETREVVRLMPDIVASVRRMRDETGRPVVLFLDEFTSASSYTQAACYQLLLDRKLAGFSLPEDTRVIAAGNLMSDRGQVNELLRPACNRMMMVNFEGPTFKEWEQYATAAGVHHGIIGFLRTLPEWLKDKIDPSQERNPTPRSWKYASDIIKAAEAANSTGPKDKPLPRDKVMFYLSTVVGDAAACQAEAVFKIASELVPYREILACPTQAHVSSDLSATYMQLQLCLERIKTAVQLKKVIQYVERCPDELAGVFFKGALTRPNTCKLMADKEVRKAMRKYRRFLADDKQTKK